MSVLSENRGRTDYIEARVLEFERKRCEECGVVKPLWDYHKNASEPDGHSRRCKECPGWRQALTADMIREVTEASEGTCPYCGEAFTGGHIDHIMPVSKGGTNDRENLVYCCAPCNLSKHAKTPEEWQGR